MVGLKKDTRVVVTTTGNSTWMGNIKELLFNVTPPKRGLTKEGYLVVPENPENGGEKIIHHSYVKPAKSKTPLEKN